LVQNPFSPGFFGALTTYALSAGLLLLMVFSFPVLLTRNCASDKTTSPGLFAFHVNSWPRCLQRNRKAMASSAPFAETPSVFLAALLMGKAAGLSCFVTGTNRISRPAQKRKTAKP
jgi:hypothetical protein